MDKTFEEVKEAFARWKVAGKRLKEVVTKETSEKTVIRMKLPRNQAKETEG